MNGFTMVTLKQMQSRNEKDHNQNKFSVLVTNYPIMVSPEAIYLKIVDNIFQHFGKQIIPTKGEIFPTYAFTLIFKSKAEMDIALNLNGCFIFNNPIWIIKYPDHFFNHHSQFLQLFAMFTSNGVIDLSNLPEKWASLGNNPNDIKFDNQSFVEYLFFRLGIESRNRNIFIETLNFNNNKIKDIKLWYKYFVFIPTLKKVMLCQTNLQKEPESPGWPFLTFVTDFKKKDEKNNDEQKNQSWSMAKFLESQSNRNYQQNAPSNEYNQMNNSNWNQQNNEETPNFNQSPAPFSGGSMGAAQPVPVKIEAADMTLDELQSQTQGNVISDIDPSLLGL